MDNSSQHPFALLPGAMVEEMLSKSQAIGNVLLSSLKEINEKKDEIKNQLLSNKLLKRFADLPTVSPPTTVAVDGAHIVERLMATDLVTAAAVAIEGLTPPSETRYWEAPYHKVFITPEKHNPDTAMIVRGIMWEMEIKLANEAPHDVVFIDGSITNPFLNLNPALTKANETPDSELSKELFENFDSFLSAYHNITTSTRSDKMWIGVPKYTSKRELGQRFGWPNTMDDRSLLSSILVAGDYIAPIPYEQPADSWHMNIGVLAGKSTERQKILNEIIKGVSNLHVCYFRPHAYTPVLRLEVSKSIVTNQYQLATLLNAIHFQCGAPGIIEPYPLYLADRMVKSISKAIPALRQTATITMAEQFGDDLSEVFFNMHSYRTEI